MVKVANNAANEERFSHLAINLFWRKRASPAHRVR
jgi:hypothetical protein